MTVVVGNYGFATVYENVVNTDNIRKNFKVVVLIDSPKGDRLSRTEEVFSVEAGGTLQVRANAGSNQKVTFRVFKHTYDTSGEYTSENVLETEVTLPLLPGGPR